MAEPLINQAITTIVKHEINQIPKIQKCTINKVYTDNIHADIQIEDTTMKYIPTISNNLTKGNIGILIPLENEYIVITK